VLEALRKEKALSRHELIDKAYYEASNRREGWDHMSSGRTQDYSSASIGKESGAQEVSAAGNHCVPLDASSGTFRKTPDLLEDSI
jgi:hypothetical protein